MFYSSMYVTPKPRGNSPPLTVLEVWPKAAVPAMTYVPRNNMCVVVQASKDYPRLFSRDHSDSVLAYDCS